MLPWTSVMKSTFPSKFSETRKRIACISLLHSGQMTVFSPTIGSKIFTQCCSWEFSTWAVELNSLDSPSRGDLHWNSQRDVRSPKKNIPSDHTDNKTNSAMQSGHLYIAPELYQIWFPFKMKGLSVTFNFPLKSRSRHYSVLCMRGKCFTRE